MTKLYETYINIEFFEFCGSIFFKDFDHGSMYFLPKLGYKIIIKSDLLIFFVFFGNNMNRNKKQTTELKKKYYCLKFKNCFATISANDASKGSK
jgi:hypothetical protein